MPERDNEGEMVHCERGVSSCPLGEPRDVVGPMRDVPDRFGQFSGRATVGGRIQSRDSLSVPGAFPCRRSDRRDDLAGISPEGEASPRAPGRGPASARSYFFASERMKATRSQISFSFSFPL